MSLRADWENSWSSQLPLHPCKRPSSWYEVRLCFLGKYTHSNACFSAGLKPRAQKTGAGTLIWPPCEVEWWHLGDLIMFARSEPQADHSMATCLVQIQPTWIKISCGTDLGNLWFILFALTMWLLYVVHVAQIWQAGVDFTQVHNSRWMCLVKVWSGQQQFCYLGSLSREFILDLGKFDKSTQWKKKVTAWHRLGLWMLWHDSWFIFSEWWHMWLSTNDDAKLIPIIILNVNYLYSTFHTEAVPQSASQ